MASYGLYTSPPITYHLYKPYPWSYGLIRVRRRSKNDWKWARISLYLIKKRVFMREMLHFKALEYLWECQNCICDVLLSSKLVLDLNLDQKWGFPSILRIKKELLPGGELNPGLPRDRRGYSPLYYRGSDVGTEIDCNWCFTNKTDCSKGALQNIQSC